jgi:hypothetical protein
MDGVTTVSRVDVADDTTPRTAPNITTLPDGVVENPLPVMVTVLPAFPMVGLIDVIVGTIAAAGAASPTTDMAAIKHGMRTLRQVSQ